MRERLMVDEPQFESYYGRPILKEPTWKTPDVPLYLFLGGLGGGSALLAEGAALADLPALERVTRIAAATASAAGTVALIHDLGRPERFLNMLRVFKPTSPLSVGSFILAPFSTFAGAAAASHVTGILPRLGRLAGVGAAVFGPPLATYTAALVANTAVPAWHEAHRELPFVFAGSGATAAGGLAMLLVPTAQAGPARRMAVAGAGMEIAAAELLVHRLGMLAEPYQQGMLGPPDERRPDDDGRGRRGDRAGRPSFATRLGPRGGHVRQRVRCSPGSASSRRAGPRRATRSTSWCPSGSG